MYSKQSTGSSYSVSSKDNESRLTEDGSLGSVSFHKEGIYESSVTLPNSAKLTGYTIDEAIDKMGFGPFQLILFLFCGFIWMADAMELMVLSILSSAVKCQWSLSNAEEALITSVVFIGSLFGSIFWGYISDNFGRKKAIIAMSCLVLLSGVLSALKLTPDDNRIPGYPWLLGCRFFVGFGVAGSPQASTYYIEFLPRRTRAICTICLAGWWAVGSMFGAALAVGVMGNDNYDWHWYIGLSGIPIALVTLVAFIFPESARVVLAKGDKKGALKILKKIQWLNFRSLPPGELLSPSQAGNISKLSEESVTASMDVNPAADEKQPLLVPEYQGEDKMSMPNRLILSIQRGLDRMKNLFVKSMWRTTLPLWLLWFGSAWLYYGCVLLMTTMLQENPHCEGRGSNSSLQFLHYEGNNDSDFSNSTECEEGELNTGDYLNILWASASEMPGILVTVIIIEILGRKLTMMIGFLVAFAGYCLLFICTSNIILTVFFFIIRSSVTGLFQTMYAYTPEVYPVNVRGLGIGVASAIARVGAILTPYIAQVLFHASDYATISLYAGTCFILAFMVLLLPIETKGKSLKD